MNTGYIYTIKSNKTPKYYIGSTMHNVLKRFGQHLHDFKHKTCSSYEIIKYGDSFIEIIESVKYDDVKFLRSREMELIKLNTNDIVNIVGTRDEDDIVLKEKKKKEKKTLNTEPIKNATYDFLKKIDIDINSTDIKKLTIDYEKIKAQFDEFEIFTNKEINITNKKVDMVDYLNDEFKINRMIINKYLCRLLKNIGFTVENYNKKPKGKHFRIYYIKKI
jgi:hypothetical protein